MADIQINRGASSASTTTTNANTELQAADDRALFFLVNVSAEPVRVFFNANNDLVLEDTIQVDYSGQGEKHTSTADVVDLARGVLVEAGQTVRAIIDVRTADTTPADNTVDIVVNTVHTPALSQINLFVASQADISGAAL